MNKITNEEEKENNIIEIKEITKYTREKWIYVYHEQPLRKREKTKTLYTRL